MAYTESIYVKSTGNDTTGNGTMDNPYLTITKAVSMMTTTSPIIYVDKGTFYVSSLQSLSKASKVVTVKGQGKDTLILTQVFTSVGFAGQLELIDFIVSRDSSVTTTEYRCLLYATDTQIVNFRNIVFLKSGSYPNSMWFLLNASSSTIYKYKNFYNCLFTGAMSLTGGYGTVNLISCAIENSSVTNANVNTNNIASVLYDSEYKTTNVDNSTYGVYSGDYTWYTDRFLFLSGGIYYTLDENDNITSTTLNSENVSTNGFKINKLASITNSQILKNISPFKIVVINSGMINQDLIKVNGVKSSTELIILKQNISMKLAQSVIKIFIGKQFVGEGNIKIVVSDDIMTSWKTWNGSNWVRLINTTFDKNYSDMTTTEKNQWNTFKNEIVSIGMNPTALETANFNNLDSTNLRFAFVLIRPTYTDGVLLTDLKMNYVGKETWQLLSIDNDISISINEDFIKLTPIRDINSTVKVNILT